MSETPNETPYDPSPRAEQSYSLGETDTLPPTVVQTKRRSRSAAHLTSLVLCLVLTPVALIACDYSLIKGWGSKGVGIDRAPTDALIAMGVAAGVLLVVAALARLSGLGPLIAGLVWGVLPAVGFALVPETTADRMLDVANPYDQFMSGLISSSAVFPVLAGLLVGIGLFGRWRGSKRTELRDAAAPEGVSARSAG